MLKYLPISETHAATLSRLINNLTSSYTRYTSGTISADRVHYLAQRFHLIHAVAASPSQRHTRKKKGLANALLTIYLAPGADYAQWFLQFTEGELMSHEKLQEATKKPFLTFAHYELVRVAKGSNYKRAAWSVRRNKEATAMLYDELIKLSSNKQYKRIKQLLEKAAKEPQFHLVREQTKALFHEAKKRGYMLEFPFLYYIQKINHGTKRIPIKDKKNPHG